MKLEDKRMLETFYGSKKKPTLLTGKNHSIKTHIEFDKDTNTCYIFEEYSLTGDVTTRYKRKYVLEDIFNPSSLSLQEVKRITTPSQKTEDYLMEIFDSEDTLADSFPHTTIVHKVFNDIEGKLTKDATRFYAPLTENPKQVCNKRHGYFSIYKNGAQYIIEFNLNEILHCFNNEGMKATPANDYEETADILERFLNVSIYKGTRRVYKERLITSYAFNYSDTNDSYTLADGTTRPCHKTESCSSNGVNPLDSEAIKCILEWCYGLEKEKDLLANTPAGVYDAAKMIVKHYQEAQKRASEETTEHEQVDADDSYHESF